MARVREPRKKLRGRFENLQLLSGFAGSRPSCRDTRCGQGEVVILVNPLTQVVQSVCQSDYVSPCRTKGQLWRLLRMKL